MENEKTKKCSKCGFDKPLDEFVKSKSSKSGIRQKCKKCSNEYYKDKRLIKAKPKEIIPDGFKKCEHCRKNKEFCDFHKSSKRKSGYSPYCKQCKKDYIENNQEKEAKRKHNWYLAHRELSIKRSCTRQIEKRVERNEYLARYYKKNPHIYAWRTLVYRTLRS